MRIGDHVTILVVVDCVVVGRQAIASTKKETKETIQHFLAASSLFEIGMFW
jgi:Na+-translocating ferredoxin:NAD+ oxidoreductase RnfE subunit